MMAQPKAQFLNILRCLELGFFGSDDFKMEGKMNSRKKFLQTTAAYCRSSCGCSVAGIS